MAASQPTAVMPGRSAMGGYVYLILFSSGAIKVGHTQNPATRMKSHAATARAHGVEIAAHWVSQPITNSRQNERRLIDFCNSRFIPVNDGEYFSGADTSDVLAFVETLDDGQAGRLLMAQVPVVDPKNGRPMVGPKVEFRLDEDVLAKVDARAAREGVKRAEMLRRIVTDAV